VNKKLILLVMSNLFFNVYAAEYHPLEIRKKVSIYSAKNKRDYQEDFFDHRTVDGGQLYAIYDGHRGTCAAQFLRHNFPTYFEAASGDNMRHKMAATCKKLNDDLTTHLQTKEKFEKTPSYGYCGSTAVIVFIIKDLAYFVHVGDSRALLEEQGKVGVATVDHKVSNSDERQRLKQAKVDDYIKVYKGCSRLKGLAVSRSFGDYALKNKLKEKRGSSGIIAEPDCTIQRLTEHHQFLVLATDGLWDVMSNEDVVQLLNEKKEDDIDDITELLVTTAISKGSRDNITVMLVDLLS